MMTCVQVGMPRAAMPVKSRGMAINLNTCVTTMTKALNCRGGRWV